MMRTLFAALLLSTSLLATPVMAQSKKELAAVDAQLAQRLSTLESRMLTGDPAAERLMQKMDALETSMRTLRGEVEQLRFERDSLLQQVEAMAGDTAMTQDLINRMKIHLDAVDLVASEHRGSPVQSGSFEPRTYGSDNMAGSTLPPLMDTESYSSQPVYPGGETLSQIPSAPVFKEQTIGVQERYNDVSELSKVGQTKLAEGDFSGAQTAFKQYLEFNPNAADAGEVNFWLGESYYVRGGYADAADAYITSMRKAPKGPKAPDAMVRLAATLGKLGNKAEACQTLATFPAQFPNASASAKEKARIEAARTGC
ncbi:tol-pal system protein YbgF [Hellea balneolensis]|uniref:tol-pal system protein YbgF n=1 Tax=Hellea balneolensis TaxID=287478 RepID=UPI000427A4BC|nr:tol-pal system protein YbgF [Hellea balneolensis]